MGHDAGGVAESDHHQWCSHPCCSRVLVVDGGVNVRVHVCATPACTEPPLSALARHCARHAGHSGGVGGEGAVEAGGEEEEVEAEEGEEAEDAGEAEAASEAEGQAPGSRRVARRFAGG